MGLLSHIDQYFRDLYTLFVSDMVREKGKIFFIYNWLVAKNLFSKITKVKFHSQSFLGFKIRFDNYGAFFALFTEMFIYNVYYFKSPVKDPFIIDCGGNIGMSLIYFKYLFPKAKIECYEPDPTTFQILKKNVQLNKFSSITLIQKGVSGKDGKMKFYSFGDIQGGSGNTLLESQVNFKNIKSFDVDVVELRKENYSKIHFLKIDIEGAEGFMFESFKENDFLSIVDNVNLEYHYDISYEGNKLSLILSVLEKYKYNIIINQNTLITFYTSRRFYRDLDKKYVLLIDCFKERNKV